MTDDVHCPLFLIGHDSIHGILYLWNCHFRIVATVDLIICHCVASLATASLNHAPQISAPPPK